MSPVDAAAQIRRVLLAVVVVGQLGYISLFLALNHADVVLLQKRFPVSVLYKGENKGIRYFQCLELEAQRPMIMQNVSSTMSAKTKTHAGITLCPP